MEPLLYHQFSLSNLISSFIKFDLRSIDAIEDVAGEFPIQAEFAFTRNQKQHSISRRGLSLVFIEGEDLTNRAISSRPDHELYHSANLNHMYIMPESSPKVNDQNFIVK
jgi:hypothetical protein